jgi:hypothetical protein
MDTRSIIGRYLFSFLLLFSFLSCEKEPVEPPPPNTEEGSWTIYSPYDWSHDGYPYSSQYWVVYSDGASTFLKQKAGLFADQKFIQIMEMFDFTNEEDFRLPRQNEKMNLYINQTHDQDIAAAYWGTIFITIRTADFDTSHFAYLFEHEITHEFEFLIEGTVNLGTDVWFREGIAIYGGGGRNYIRNVSDLNRWISQNSHFPNGGNPISIHRWGDFPEGSDIPGYYMVFDVVMKYILDENGLGRSLDDVLTVFYDMRNGMVFSTSFQNNFGISLSEFEAQIFDRLANYLSQYPPFAFPNISNYGIH